MYRALFAYPVWIVSRGYLDEYDGVGVHVGGGRDAAEQELRRLVDPAYPLFHLLLLLTQLIRVGLPEVRQTEI